MSIRNADVPMGTLGQRNTWPLPSGELAVRPGLRQLKAIANVVAGASFRVSTTDDVWHYVITSTTSGGAKNVIRLLTYDRDLNQRQSLVVGSGRPPRSVTFSSVLGDLLICSPDFPTLAGYVGGGVYFASPVASASAKPVLRVPQGLGVVWAGRSAIAEGAGLYLSDPRTITGGSILSFVGRNAQWRPGVIYGLHVAAGGSLVACTTEGVFALPVSAAAAGQVAVPNWTQLSSHRTTDYGQTCMASGRIYGLTERGVRLIDTEAAPEQDLSETVSPRVFGARIARHDWRNARIFARDEGPAVASGLLGDPFWMAREGFASWWSGASGFAPGALVGVLSKEDGEELLLCEAGIYRIVGDFDGTEALSSEGNAVTGWCHGSVPTAPQQSLVAVDVTVGAEFNAGNVLCSLRGVDGSGSDGRGDPQTTYGGANHGVLIDGVNAWGDGRILEERALTSRRAQYKLRTDDFGFEVGATHGQTRLSPTCRILFDGVDEERPLD